MTDTFPCYIEKKDEGEDITFQYHQCINRFIVANKDHYERILMSINIENINFRDLYKLDIGGLNIDYDVLMAYTRDELIEIRNIFQKLKDLSFVIKETELRKIILLIDVRDDLSPLWINEIAMSEFIKILNIIIIDRAIEERRNI